MVDLLPFLKKGTDKILGCVDLCKHNSCIRYEHFKMEGFKLFRSSSTATMIVTKVDLTDLYMLYMHFLISKAGGRYMRFVWEGRKYECIGMPFGLAPAPRLATKMMAPVTRYL